MNRRNIAAIGLVLSALATGPANASAIISSAGVAGRYDHQEYSAAVDGQELQVEVRGVPFAGMTQEAFDQVLTGVLTATRQGRPAARFTIRPTGTSFDPSYRLVMVFGPARNLASETLCRALDSAKFEPVAASEVKVSVAFCRKGELLSHAIARVSAMDVNDPDFGQLFAQLLPALFPARNPLVGGGQ